MRKLSIIMILLVVGVASCVMEPPMTFYTFKIVNKTKTLMVVESKQKNNSEVLVDTLRQNDVFIKEIPRWGSYEDYHDTLIHSFFQKLEIRPVNGALNLDVFRSANWIGPQCKATYISYTLEINEIDLQ